MNPAWFTKLGAAIRAAFGPISSGFPDEWQMLPPLHIDENGWLEGEGVVRIASDPSWYYPELSTPTGDPLAIVCHVSATNRGTGVTMANNRARKRRPRMPGMSKDDVALMKLFERWQILGDIKKIGPANRTALGIEIVGWEKGPFPEGQVQQAGRLWRAIVQSYGVKRAVAMVPHAVIDPARRSDPGKIWMAEHAPRVLDYAFGT